MCIIYDQGPILLRWINWEQASNMLSTHVCRVQFLKYDIIAMAFQLKGRGGISAKRSLHYGMDK